MLIIAMTTGIQRVVMNGNSNEWRRGCDVERQVVPIRWHLSLSYDFMKKKTICDKTVAEKRLW